MDTLIIYAHPDTGGHCAYILKQVKKELTKNEAEFEVVDLYKENYDPVMKKEELYTAGNNKVSKNNQKYQKKIKKADKLILIYPVWWGSMPAILKGFLDRIFTPGFAYTYKEKRLLGALPKRLLKDKKALVFQTLGGPRWIYFLLGNPPKRIINFFTLWYSGFNTKVVQFFNVSSLDKKRKQKIKARVKSELK